MNPFASMPQVAAFAAAVSWPFAVGLAVVLWSKARSARRAREVAALEGRLQSIFRTAEAQPVPDRLNLVVEALEEGEAMAVRGKAAKEGRKKAGVSA